MLHPKITYDAPEQASLEPELTVISLEGEFDLSERSHLLDTFALAMSAGTVVVNFKKTRFVDSTVLECLVALEKATTQRGARLVLVDMQPEVARIFDVCGLDRLFEIRDELGEITGPASGERSRTRRVRLIARTSEADFTGEIDPDEAG
jgi:anti-sigma B factor antagonist